ncbi:AEC family transporter [Martelella sp. HB161492]|uniref:AEC family transporter n=1 Tax=Martelella sp. HB161492 TaxID=2720726 RepID=UPI001591CF58|nr:AEC family transporter [Martelella sp. HB161492]
MLTVLGIIFPVFAMIAVGYGAVRKGLVAQSDISGLGRFVVNVCLPALLFSAVTSSDRSDFTQPLYLSIYAVCGLVNMGLIWLAVSIAGAERTRRAAATLGASTPNSAYIGYPILLLALPEIAAPVFAMNVVVENFLFLPLGLMLLEQAQTVASPTPFAMVRRLLKSILTKPMILGMFAGLAVALLGIPLPHAFVRLVDMIAQATPAVALFFIGGTLVGLPLRGHLNYAVLVASAKLLIFPALAVVMAACLAFFGCRFSDPRLFSALILSSAMPIFGMYAIFTQEVGHEGMASIAMLTSIIGAFFTLSALLIILL